MSSLERRFPRKRVLITGATSGLGRALALEFYSVPQSDARLMWCLARWLPERYSDLLTYLFHKRFWVFSA